MENYEIPNSIHKIWLGGMLPDEYVGFLRDLSVAALDPINRSRDVEINIWLDDSAMRNNIHQLKEIPGLKINKISDLIENFIKSTDFNEEEKANFLRCLFIEYLPPTNYAAIADFLRIELLRQKGGMYIDTDVGMNSSFEEHVNMIEQDFIEDAVFNKWLDFMCEVSESVYSNRSIELFAWVENLIAELQVDVDLPREKKLNDSILKDNINKIKKSDPFIWDAFLKYSYHIQFDRELLSKTGICNSYRNNNVIIASRNHPVLINILKNMIKNEMDLFDPNKDKLFESREKVMLAKKCQYKLDSSEFTSNEVCQYVLNHMYTNINQEVPFIKYMTINIGVVPVFEHVGKLYETIERPLLSKLQEKIGSTLRTTRCDHTWFSENKLNQDEINAMKALIDGSAKLYFDNIVDMEHASLLKSVTENCFDITKTIAYIEEMKQKKCLLNIW